MNIFNEYKQKISEVLQQLAKTNKLEGELNLEAVTAEPPKDASHGDIATNAAMVVCKNFGMNPKQLAEQIMQQLKADKNITDISIAGPGFINISLKDQVWQDVIIDILECGKGFGNSDIGAGKKVNIEYVSANPTGPMHIGHARGAVYGDALSLLLLKAGYEVTKEYYINDKGVQIENLAKSAYLRYKEALGQDIGEIPKGLYPGEYLKVVGVSLIEKYQRQLLDMEPHEWLPIVRDFTVDAMLALIKSDLYDLGIVQDVFSSEKEIHERGLVEKSVDMLEKKGLIYQGILEAPKGKTPEDWEPREQTLFKATQFGDDIDRALRKSDGSYTYFAADIAYHYDKISRGFNDMVIVLGADHGGYIKRLKAVVRALSDNMADIDVKISQLVRFLENGEVAKMSKRAGTFTTVRDVIDEVGKDIIRFIMLTRKNDAVLDFDIALVKQQSKDNPIFYVQYAHARAKSVIRNAVHESPESYELMDKIDHKAVHLLHEAEELLLVKKLATWPRIVESAAIAHEPHRIAFYIQEVAALFHALWNKGNENATLRFIIKEDKTLTAARLMLVKAVATVIASALMIFNIEPKDEMR